MEENFYLMNYGGATRYIILIPKNIDPDTNKEFIKLLKKGKIIFTEGQGKSEGDLLGGSWVTTFFSEKFINLLNQNEVKNYNLYRIKFESKYNNKGKYYYIEPIFFVDFIVDGTYLKKDERENNQKKLDEWIKNKNKIYFEGDKYMKSFYNMSTWNGSDFFGAKNTKVIVVTEKLKKVIEKAKLKNIMFGELKKYEY